MGKKIILIGQTGSGKTTLIQRIEEQQLIYRKTQTIFHYTNFIDTPGEYLEHRNYYKALIISSYDADVIGFVQSSNSEDVWLPPMFSSVFTKETIGIVTKIDLANEEQIDNAKKLLKLSGVTRIFCVSAITNVGIEEITRYIL